MALSYPAASQRVSHYASRSSTTATVTTHASITVIAATIRAHVPSRHHNRYRLYSVCQAPNSVGISRHPTPARIIHSNPARIGRCAPGGRPRLPVDGDNSGARRAHNSSVNVGVPATRMTCPCRCISGDWRRARRAVWHRFAVAWCVRRHCDQRRCCWCCSASPPAKLSRRRVSGTVSATRVPPPFLPPLPAPASRLARRARAAPA